MSRLLRHNKQLNKYVSNRIAIQHSHANIYFSAETMLKTVLSVQNEGSVPQWHIIRGKNATASIHHAVRADTAYQRRREL